MSGGGDCDEMVMNGILEGLLDTQPYSPLFVFTDAGSKDKEEMESVLTFAQVRFIVHYIVHSLVLSIVQYIAYSSFLGLFFSYIIIFVPISLTKIKSYHYLPGPWDMELEVRFSAMFDFLTNIKPPSL